MYHVTEHRARKYLDPATGKIHIAPIPDEIRKGRLHWSWCFQGDDFSVFHISPSRGSNVLKKVLGETFGGTPGCDYYSAYRKYMTDCDVSVQFCMAHLIREICFLAEHIDKKLSRWAGKLL